MDNKSYFKEKLRLIEIELFSYCNRRCWFCANSLVDRRSSNTFMPEELYLSILKQLSEINYDGEVTYSRYNEPLSQKEVFLNRLTQARSYLPSALLRTNSNGDYLKRDYVFELRDAGLNQLFVQQYLEDNEEYNHDKIKERMLKKLKGLGIPFSVMTDIRNRRIEFNLEVPNMTVHLRARNYQFEGTSRTGKDRMAEINKEWTRTKACAAPFHNMYIDYNGAIAVCANHRFDIPHLKKGMTGHVSDGLLWDIYMNERYLPWREMHKVDSPKVGICKTCKLDHDFVGNIYKTQTTETPPLS